MVTNTADFLHERRKMSLKKLADTSFSDRLKSERLRKGIKTMPELAELSGIPYDSLKKYESPRYRRIPEKDNLLILAKTLNVSPLYLLGETPYRSTWEEYDSLHEEDLKRIRIETRFIEYAESLGCDFTNFDQEDFSLFQTTVNKCILETYKGVQGRKENNE